ncbi:SycD/LcrH family type III secretion system chaperone [Candidatus Fukatsuia symbiotica]|uniref:CesD/SycD/LcrH family type III secretion system chaperone n=1 Tax=Candidatus Fukatsuia symbiotica TaxID=1878942 RepID=A0A2U8I4E4_9GAMM|nr:SycD/LcrH family type III secretion system chaperone [Candidatus Fukatsuia symbiotica]AWK13989.1 CesD/SycD/LcrH family type III secretion system chaperone [Candidatus Fukatsuia symbiotica]MEA9445666.1 SycD/LcrH family type III secretion system chaperone [Candidatus Fukatsuia symbiotica]
MNISYQAANNRKKISRTNLLTTRQEVHHDDGLDAEQLYARGYEAWQKKDYVAALTDFTWLTQHYPGERRFHLAMAGALQMQGEYLKALTCYDHAQALDICDPAPLCEMAVCLQALGRKADAREVLQTVIEISYVDPAYTTIREKANRLLAKI